MANTFLKPTVIARTGLALLQRDIVLPRLIWSFGQSDFQGAANDTITLRVPAVLTARDYEWRTRTNPIVIDDVTETGVDVKLDTHLYSAVAVTDEQLTLDIVSFATQILQPQTRAVAERMENKIAAAMAAAPVPADGSQEVELTRDNPYAGLVRARRILNTANVPMSERVLVIGTEIEEVLLSSDKLTDVDRSGSASALRDANLGRIAGFTAVVSNAIDPDVGYAFHRTAFALGIVAPEVPDGATMGRSESNAGLAMRWIRDYDPNYLRDRSVVSSFFGVSSVNSAMGDTGDVDTDPDDAINPRLVKLTLEAEG